MNKQNKKMSKLNFNNKKIGELRFWWSKKPEKVLIKCNDCENKLLIIFPIVEDLYEINGVIATRDEWQQIFKKIKLI